MDTYSLCVFQNPSLALKEMSRVVRKSGKVLLLEHSRSSNPALGLYQVITHGPYRVKKSPGNCNVLWLSIQCERKALIDSTTSSKIHLSILFIDNAHRIMFASPPQDIVAEPVAAMSKGCVWNQNVLSLLEDSELEVIDVANGLGGLINVITAAPKS